MGFTSIRLGLFGMRFQLTDSLFNTVFGNGGSKFSSIVRALPGGDEADGVDAD